MALHTARSMHFWHNLYGPLPVEDRYIYIARIRAYVCACILREREKERGRMKERDKERDQRDWQWVSAFRVWRWCNVCCTFVARTTSTPSCVGNLDETETVCVLALLQESSFCETTISAESFNPFLSLFWTTVYYLAIAHKHQIITEQDEEFSLFKFCY